MTSERKWALVKRQHASWVSGRRARALAASVSPFLKPGWSVLDVGCGDGSIALALAQEVPQLTVRGLEVQPRASVSIPVASYDGVHIPVGDGAVDAVTFVDVLHHAIAPLELLQDARRIARRRVIIKDHRTSRPAAHLTLRFMDRVGNVGHQSAAPNGYWSTERWKRAFIETGYDLVHWQTEIGLYPWPASWVFERGLHFVAVLSPRK